MENYLKAIERVQAASKALGTSVAFGTNSHKELAEMHLAMRALQVYM